MTRGTLPGFHLTPDVCCGLIPQNFDINDWSSNAQTCGVRMEIVRVFPMNKDTPRQHSSYAIEKINSPCNSITALTPKHKSGAQNTQRMCIPTCVSPNAS